MTTNNVVHIASGKKVVSIRSLVKRREMANVLRDIDAKQQMSAVVRWPWRETLLEAMSDITDLANRGSKAIIFRDRDSKKYISIPISCELTAANIASAMGAVIVFISTVLR